MTTLRTLVITPAELRCINDALALQEAALDTDYEHMSGQALAALRTANERTRMKVHALMKPGDYK